MRTRTLLLTAAISAAGVATSMAQVFSANVVGYVSKTIPSKKFALISNPLVASDNKISALFKDAPDGTQIFKFDAAKVTYVGANVDFGAVVGGAAGLDLKPGEGAFVKNNGNADITITFVGEVPQGDLKTSLVKGFQIVSSQVPQRDTVDKLGLVGAEGDRIFAWNVGAQSYKGFTFEFGSWSPALEPVEVGDAFFLSKAAAGSWDRKFTVSQ